MFFDTKECEWSDFEIYIDGTKVTKVTGLKYKKTVEKEALYAAGSDPFSIQRGNKGYSGTLTLLRGAVSDINRAVKAAGGEDLTDAEFSIVGVYKAKGNRSLSSVRIGTAEFSEFEDGLMQNDKKGEIALPFIFLDLTLS